MSELNVRSGFGAQPVTTPPPLARHTPSGILQILQVFGEQIRAQACSLGVRFPGPKNCNRQGVILGELDPMNSLSPSPDGRIWGEIEPMTLDRSK